MSSEQIGLQTDSFTWVIAAVLLAVWAMALPVLVSGFRLKRWQGSATSLLGLAWLGFGVDIVFRFFLLAYESVSFGNMTTRLADRPATVVNEALVVAVVYLTAFVATGGISRLLPKP